MAATGFIVLFYTEGLWSVLFVGVCLLIQIVFGHRIVYLNPYTPSLLVSDVCLIMLWVIFAALIVMAMVKVSELLTELGFTNRENKKLLNTFDKGLLVYKNSHKNDFDSILQQSAPKSIMFCNLKARQLLTMHLKGDLFQEKAFYPQKSPS